VKPIRLFEARFCWIHLMALWFQSLEQVLASASIEELMDSCREPCPTKIGLSAFSSMPPAGGRGAGASPRRHSVPVAGN